MIRPDVFIVAAEPSGDQLGADLVRALRGLDETLGLAVIGGSTIESTGLKSRISVDGLAILGFVEGLKAYPHVLRKVDEAAKAILGANPKAVVLIDSWGFMMRLAKRLKAKGFEGRVIKYVAPQVWATRPGRAKILAAHVDHLLSTQRMDAPYFEQTGLDVSFVGNPVLDRAYDRGDAAAFRSEHGLEVDTPLAGLFLGSRPSEIQRVGPAIIAAFRKAREQFPALKGVCVLADAVREDAEALLEGTGVLCVDQSAMSDAMAAMDAALACSGTVTTQLAAAGVPTVVMYELSPVTYFLIRRVFQPRYVSLVNISADGPNELLETPLLPEFLQDEIHGDGPGEALLAYLRDGSGNAALRDRLKQETRRMGAGSESASDKAARAVLDLIR